MSAARGAIRVLAVAIPREVLAEYEGVVTSAGYLPGSGAAEHAGGAGRDPGRRRTGAGGQCRSRDGDDGDRARRCAAAAPDGRSDDGGSCVGAGACRCCRWWIESRPRRSGRSRSRCRSSQRRRPMHLRLTAGAIEPRRRSRCCCGQSGHSSDDGARGRAGGQRGGGLL